MSSRESDDQPGRRHRRLEVARRADLAAWRHGADQRAIDAEHRLRRDEEHHATGTEAHGATRGLAGRAGGHSRLVAAAIAAAVRDTGIAAGRRRAAATGVLRCWHGLATPGCAAVSVGLGRHRRSGVRHDARRRAGGGPEGQPEREGGEQEAWGGGVPQAWLSGATSIPACGGPASLPAPGRRVPGGGELTPIVQDYSE